jgi:hypothetical protein
VKKLAIYFFFSKCVLFETICFSCEGAYISIMVQSFMQEGPEIKYLFLLCWRWGCWRKFWLAMLIFTFHSFSWCLLWLESMNWCLLWLESMNIWSWRWWWGKQLLCGYCGGTISLISWHIVQLATGPTYWIRVALHCGEDSSSDGGEWERWEKNDKVGSFILGWVGFLYAMICTMFKNIHL